MRLKWNVTLCRLRLLSFFPKEKSEELEAFASIAGGEAGAAATARREAKARRDEELEDDKQFIENDNKRKQKQKQQQGGEGVDHPRVSERAGKGREHTLHDGVIGLLYCTSPRIVRRRCPYLRPTSPNNNVYAFCSLGFPLLHRLALFGYNISRLRSYRRDSLHQYTSTGEQNALVYLANWSRGKYEYCSALPSM